MNHKKNVMNVATAMATLGMANTRGLEDPAIGPLLLSHASVMIKINIYGLLMGIFLQFSDPDPLVGRVPGLQSDPREEAGVVQESAQDCQDSETHKHEEQIQGKSCVNVWSQLLLYTVYEVHSNINLNFLWKFFSFYPSIFYYGTEL